MSKRSASRSSDQEVMRHLSRSQIFKDYERAFSKATGLPLNIPTKKHFATITQQLRAWGYNTDSKQLERAYCLTRVLSPDRYHAMLRLLGIFEQHLSIVSNQLVVQHEKDESANMARARQFI